jgi:hypothetical protein
MTQILQEHIFGLFLLFFDLFFLKNWIIISKLSNNNRPPITHFKNKIQEWKDASFAHEKRNPGVDLRSFLEIIQARGAGLSAWFFFFWKTNYLMPSQFLPCVKFLFKFQLIPFLISHWSFFFFAHLFSIVIFLYVFLMLQRYCFNLYFKFYSFLFVMYKK